MTHLNKKRAGDENIGKLIMFSITIIIAVGLVGLITFFYNQSRENAVAGSVLGSSASSLAEIQSVVLNIAGVDACDDMTAFDYNAISGLYTITTTANGAVCGGATGLAHANFAKVITVESAAAGSVTYKMK